MHNSNIEGSLFVAGLFLGAVSFIGWLVFGFMGNMDMAVMGFRGLVGGVAMIVVSGIFGLKGGDAE